MKIIKFHRKNAGMGLVEIIIGSAIIATGILAIIASYGTYIKYALVNQKNVEVSYLLEEGLEAVTFIRDEGWTKNIATLGVGTTYYLNWNGTTWATSTTPQYVDGLFLRGFTLSNVNRGADDQISDIGADDPNTKLITVSVAYGQDGATTTKSMSSYITNINND